MSVYIDVTIIVIVTREEERTQAVTASQSSSAKFLSTYTRQYVRSVMATVVKARKKA